MGGRGRRRAAHGRSLPACSPPPRHRPRAAAGRPATRLQLVPEDCQVGHANGEEDSDGDGTHRGLHSRHSRSSRKGRRMACAWPGKLQTAAMRSRASRRRARPARTPAWHPGATGGTGAAGAPMRGWAAVRAACGTRASCCGLRGRASGCRSLLWGSMHRAQPWGPTTLLMLFCVKAAPIITGSTDATSSARPALELLPAASARAGRRQGGAAARRVTGLGGAGRGRRAVLGRTPADIVSH